MFLQTKIEKKKVIETFIERITIEFDEKNDCYYVGIPSNIVVHSFGSILLKGGDSFIIAADQLHLNPPKTFFGSASDKLKRIFKV